MLENEFFSYESCRSFSCSIISRQKRRRFIPPLLLCSSLGPFSDSLLNSCGSFKERRLFYIFDRFRSCQLHRDGKFHVEMVKDRLYAFGAAQV